MKTCGGVYEWFEEHISSKQYFKSHFLSQEKHISSIINATWLMQFRNTIAIYPESHTNSSGVHSASNRTEYQKQKNVWGRWPVGKADNLTAICRPTI
jgi:hypothetical protein